MCSEEHEEGIGEGRFMEEYADWRMMDLEGREDLKDDEPMDLKAKEI